MSQSTAVSFHASDIPNLNGYVAIVTGGIFTLGADSKSGDYRGVGLHRLTVIGNSGIGVETTLQLALHGARVYVAGRSPDRVHKAIADMKASHKESLDLHPLIMDLQSLQSVKDAADLFTKKESRLDILINNAAIMAVPYKLTPNGFETQWQTNHLAPFFLVQRLLPLLKSTAAASPSKSRVRIVNVSAEAALRAPIAPKALDTTTPNLEYITGQISGWKRYGHSKLASIIHARALHDRLASEGITAYSLHPGIIKTNLQSADQSLFGSVLRGAFGLGIMPGVVSVADGARTTLYCATAERAVEGSGRYFLPFGEVDGKRSGKWCDDKKTVDRLWEESERMIRDAGF